MKSQPKQVSVEEIELKRVRAFTRLCVLRVAQELARQACELRERAGKETSSEEKKRSA